MMKITNIIRVQIKQVLSLEGAHLLFEFINLCLNIPKQTPLSSCHNNLILRKQIICPILCATHNYQKKRNHFRYYSDKKSK